MNETVRVPKLHKVLHYLGKPRRKLDVMLINVFVFIRPKECVLSIHVHE